MRLLRECLRVVVLLAVAVNAVPVVVVVADAAAAVRVPALLLRVAATSSWMWFVSEKAALMRGLLLWGGGAGGVYGTLASLGWVCGVVRAGVERVDLCSGVFV